MNLINVQLNITATPGLQFLKPNAAPHAGDGSNGFALKAEAILPYEQLSATLSAYLQGTRLEISEGLINQYIVIDGCRIMGDGGELLVAVSFLGSFQGAAQFRGTPFYDRQTQTAGLKNLTYDLKTPNFLLKGLKWLFHKLIEKELKKYTVIDLAAHRQKAADGLTELLNNKWANGVEASGTVTTLEITEINVQPLQLRIGMQCTGGLQLTLPPLKLDL